MMNNEKRFIWLGGEIVSIDKAKVNVLSPTSQFGANVFEGIRCYWNDEEQQLYAFRLDDHYKRLQNSIRLFQMDSNFTNQNFEDALIKVVRANQYREDIAVRQTVFIDGFGTWSSRGPVNMFVAPISKSRKDNDYLGSQSCCVSSWTRISEKNMSPRAKVGANYINSRLGQLEAIQNGYDTCIFLNEEGKVAEGPGSCFFMVRNETLVTPPLSASVLESITRDTIIYIAKNILQIPVVERTVDRTELYICEEAFLCGSAMEVGPISKVDSFILNDGKVGKITKNIHKIYLDILMGKVKIDDWLTPIYKKNSK